MWSQTETGEPFPPSLNSWQVTQLKGDRIATRVFTPADQLRFAEMSGDWNEIHIDPMAARHSMGGQRVVHGMHSVLWAAEAFLSSVSTGLAGLSATFRRPVYLDEEVDLVVDDDEETHVKLSVRKGSAKLIDIRLVLGEIFGSMSDGRESFDLPREPIELTIEEIAGREGALEIPASNGELESAFPALAAAIGSTTTAQLAATSRLVGMTCPGRYSLLSGVDFKFEPDGSASGIGWRVTRADSRVSAVTIELRGGRVSGSIQAFVRPRPTVQPDMGEIADVIQPGEFQGQRALVVGGSRGLGELTAKLLTAGGADVVITWLNASADSDRVVTEIEAAGGNVTAQRLDVADPSPAVGELAAWGWVPTHVYYYATPPIFVRRISLYDPDLFGQFADVYVGGFARVIEACHAYGADRLRAFAPSSVAVDESPGELLEYAAAKAAGEVAARAMATANPWLDVVIRRLPRLPTDQTATFIPVPTEDPMTVMVDVVRAVSGRSSTSDGGQDHSE